MAFYANRTNVFVWCAVLIAVFSSALFYGIFDVYKNGNGGLSSVGYSIPVIILTPFGLWIIIRLLIDVVTRNRPLVFIEDSIIKFSILTVDKISLSDLKSVEFRPRLIGVVEFTTTKKKIPFPAAWFVDDHQQIIEKVMNLVQVSR